MSENKKFRIQNGVDIRGEMSFGDQVVVDDSLNITGKTITADTFEGDGSNLTGVVKPSDLNTLIDSDYIQERVVLDGVGIDSADAQLLIDVEKNRAQSAEQVNATAIQSNTNAIDAERQARIEGDQLAVNGRTVQFATLEAMISAEETRATVAEAGLSQDIVDSTSLSISGDSDLQSQINSIKAGDTEFTGDLIPDQDNVHSLGSETKMWKDVYVGPGSLYINGQKVIEDNSGTITVNADPGQNLSLNTSGGGAIDLNSGDESVQIRSDLIISSSKTISTAGGAATKFGGDVDMQSNQIGNLGVPLQSTDAATKQYVDSVIAVPHTGTKTFDDDVVIGGTLTVKGSTTTIESETLSVADNMVDLNSNMTSGTPTENAGIRVLRGDESPKSFLWKESQGTWSAEGPITATTYYGDGSNLVGIDVYTDADVTALVDSDYVQSRVVIPESGTDSAEVISLIPTQIEAYNSANNVHFSGTNVGIGTSSPSNPLHVAAASTDVAKFATTGAYNYISLDNATRNWALSTGSAFGIYDATAASTRMAIDASGNVGINATTIAANGLQIGNTSSTDTEQLYLYSNKGIFSLEVDGGNDAAGTIMTYSWANGGQGNLRFKNASGEVARFDSSGNFLVGKSASSFTTAGVELAQGGTAGKVQIQRSSSPLTLVNLTDDGNILNFYKGTSAVGAVGVAPGNKMSVIGTNQNLQIGANGTNVFNVSTSSVYPDTDNSTNLGFSTSHGRWKHLYLSGSAELGDGHNLSWGGHFAGGNPTISASSHFISFYPEGNVSGETARIDRSGNVGIGQTTIIDAASGRKALTIGGSTSSIITFGNAGTRWGGIYAASSDYSVFSDSLMRFETGSGEAMRIDANGNFMVGATSAFDSSSFCVDQSGLGQFRRDGTPLIIRRDGAYGTLIDFEQDGATVGSITSDAGSVGIGSGNVGLMFYDGGDRIIPRNGTNTSDAAIDLGFSTDRFKDLYLSGNAYIGGNTAIHSGNIGSQSVSASGVSYRLGDTPMIDFSRPGLTWFDLNNPGSTGLNGTTSYNPVAEGGQDSWYHHLMMTHNNSNGYYTELVAGFHTNELWMHRVQSGLDKGWVEFIHSGNISDYATNGYADPANGQAITLRTSVGTERGSISAHEGTSNLRIATSGNESIAFYDATTENVRINGSGDVELFNGSIGVSASQSVRFNGTGDITHAVGYDSTIDGSFMRGQNGMRFLTGTGAGTERMRIDSSGITPKVPVKIESSSYFIGNASQGYRFNNEADTLNLMILSDNGDMSLLNGNMSVSGTITESSSITYKENVDPITNALELVTQLVGVTYDRKDGSAKDRAGLIAEQVNEVLPNVVKKNEEGGAEAIAYTNLIAYLIESVKELKSEIDELRGK